jgi:hypothetical protein
MMRALALHGFKCDIGAPASDGRISLQWGWRSEGSDQVGVGAALLGDVGCRTCIFVTNDHSTYGRNQVSWDSEGTSGIASGNGPHVNWSHGDQLIRSSRTFHTAWGTGIG